MGTLEQDNDGVAFHFQLNWIYQWMDKHSISAYPSENISEIFQSKSRPKRFLHVLLYSDSYWVRFFLTFIFILIFFHIVPILLAFMEGVAFPSNQLKLSFVRDLTEYGFSFVVMVLVMSRKRFSKIQNEVLNELIQGSVFHHTRDDIKKMADKLKFQREKFQPVILAASFLFSALLLFTLLRDNLDSWHGYKISSNNFLRILGLTELPTLCGLYVCCMVVWPSGLYLILNGAMDGLYWLHFIYKLTMEEENKKLNINPFHPDHCGGLHVFKYSVLAWSALIVAVGVVVVMDTINYTGFLGAPITRWDIMMKLGSWIVLAMVIFLGPMCCLTWKLYEARREGERTAAKWGLIKLKELQQKIDDPQIVSKDRIGKIVSDINDLGRVSQMFFHASTMSMWPLDLKSVLQLIATVAGPLSILLIPSKLNQFLTYLGVY